MWTTENWWFDLSVWFGLNTLGTICFGRFEDWKPRWKRVLKLCIGTTIFVGLLLLGGRPLAWGIAGALFLVVIFIHAVWLPNQGINGWTGEPREKYLELVRSRSRSGAL